MASEGLLRASLAGEPRGRVSAWTVNTCCSSEKGHCFLRRQMMAAWLWWVCFARLEGRQPAASPLHRRREGFLPYAATITGVKLIFRGIKVTKLSLLIINFLSLDQWLRIITMGRTPGSLEHSNKSQIDICVFFYKFDQG
jgi:hypothetical protein